MKSIALGVLERGVKMLLSDKYLKAQYADIEGITEKDFYMKAQEFTIIGKALGETLASFEYPPHFRRLLARKDCPQYMKELHKLHINAYYPKLSLPEEEHWVTIDK